MFILHFNEVFVLIFFLSWQSQNRGFGTAALGIVAVLGLSAHFDVTGLNQRK
jgi:hypothetical protein